MAEKAKNQILDIVNTARNDSIVHVMMISSIIH